MLPHPLRASTLLGGEISPKPPPGGGVPRGEGEAVVHLTLFNDTVISRSLKTMKIFHLELEFKIKILFVNVY